MYVIILCIVRFFVLFSLFIYKENATAAIIVFNLNTKEERNSYATFFYVKQNMIND